MQRGGATLPASLKVRDIITGFRQSLHWATVVQLDRRLNYRIAAPVVDSRGRANGAECA